MLDNQNKITVAELKAYLYSLESEKANEIEERIYEYKINCEDNEKKIKDKEIQKIEKNINKEYDIKLKTRDEILNLLEECSEIPTKMERLDITKYMISRVDIKKAEKVVSKAVKRLGRRYNEIIEQIEEEIEEFPRLDDIEEIDLSEYKVNGKKLEAVKQTFKESFTEEEKMALIQKELDIIEKMKIFNTTPIPHEILKNSDKDMQLKMQKFNNVRQKRLRILSTMKDDYLKLLEPREVNKKLDDSIFNIETIGDILTKSEYNSVKNSIIKRRKKIYKSTSEIRNIIKSKEKKTGVINYNIQEARYGRMEKLRNIISEANSKIKEYTLVGVEEQLEKLKISYEREKQFAAVIEKLEEESDVHSDNEVKVFENQINNLEEKINVSKKVIKEQTEEIAKAKKELFILWKIEIDSTISRKVENLELPETTQSNDTTESDDENKKTSNKLLLKLKKMQNGKHACA